MGSWTREGYQRPGSQIRIYDKMGDVKFKSFYRPRESGNRSLYNLPAELPNNLGAILPQIENFFNVSGKDL